MKLTPVRNIALAAVMAAAPVAAKAADTNTVAKVATAATQTAPAKAALKAIGGNPAYTYGAEIGNIYIRMDYPSKGLTTIEYPYMAQKPVDLCLESTTDLKNWSLFKKDLPWAEDTTRLNSLGAVTNYSGSVSFPTPNNTGACFRVVDKGINQ